VADFYGALPLLTSGLKLVLGSDVLQQLTRPAQVTKVVKVNATSMGSSSDNHSKCTCLSTADTTCDCGSHSRRAQDMPNTLGHLWARLGLPHTTIPCCYLCPPAGPGNTSLQMQPHACKPHSGQEVREAGSPPGAGAVASAGSSGSSSSRKISLTPAPVGTAAGHCLCCPRCRQQSVCGAAY